MAAETAAVIGSRPWCNMQFGAAILAAPLAWYVLSWMTPIVPIHLVWSHFYAGRMMVAILVYPVLEEIVFRGWMQGEMRRLQWGRARLLAGMTRANVLTSLIFTACHFLTHSPLAALSVLIPSLIFGYFRDRYDADHIRWLAAPIGLHIWYNLGYFLLFTSI